MSWLKEMFGRDRAVIGVCHLKALPGDPLYDKDGGMEKVYEAALADVRAMQAGGIHAINFSNEFSFPYVTNASVETVAAMAAVIGELKRDLSVPLGVSVCCDSMATISLAAAVGAKFARGTWSGVFATHYGLMDTNGGEAIRLRHNLGIDDLKMVYYVIPETGKCIGGRDPIEAAKQINFMSHPDAFGVTGLVAGQKANTQLLGQLREAIPDAVLVATTGLRPENAAEIFRVADAAFVASYLKKDGIFENPVDVERVKKLMEAVNAV